MSLTEEALNRRKWRDFPKLGSLLDGEQLSIRWTGASTASDNIFERVDRLLGIYALVEESSNEIERLMAEPEHPIKEELFRLSERLTWVAEIFTNASRSVEALAHRRRRT